MIDVASWGIALQVDSEAKAFVFVQGDVQVDTSGIVIAL
jgi:hypothetical protein